jgi:hypothetical protein
MIRPVVAWATVVAVLGIAGCSSPSTPNTSGRSRPAAVVSPSAPLPSSFSESSAGPSPRIAPTGGPGTLLVSAVGVGSKAIALASVPREGSRLTVRMTCLGRGKVLIKNQSGDEILETGGCAAGVIYSSSWASTLRDGRRFSLSFDSATRWVVDVWLGDPALKLVPPPADRT